MKTLEWKTVDKSTWGPGEWQDEPDKRQWQDLTTGLACLAVRNEHGGNWCGYVGLPPGHPLHGKDYGDADVEVHGGLTFADTCHKDEDDPSRYVCHLPEPGEPEKVWWFGFDCHHHMDFAPAYAGARGSGETYKALGYVERECTELARQLKAVSDQEPT
jgi:hypothetical protein